MDRTKVLKVTGACAVVVSAAAAGILVVSPATRNSPGVVHAAPEIDPGIASLINSNLAAIEGLHARLLSAPLHEVTLPNVVHAIGAFGSGHELTINGERVGTLQWLLEEAAHKPLIGGEPAVASGVAGWQFRRPRRVAEFGVLEGHLGQSLFYLSEAIPNPDDVIVRVPDGDAATLRNVVVSLEREIHSVGIDTSYALPVLFRWSNPSGWTNRFGEQWNAGRLLELHLEREPFEHFCGGAHWCYALAFAIHGHHNQRLPDAICRAAKARLDAILRDAIESIDEEGEIHWSLQGKGSAVSRQAHALEWILLTVDNELLSVSPSLHLAVEWLILQTEWQFGTMSFRDLAHVGRALRSYDAKVRATPVEP